MSQYGLSSIILSRISMSSDIEFGWSAASGVFKHTAIVLKFDGVPLFTIDYGPEGGAFGSVGSNLSTSNRPTGSSHVAVGASVQASAVVGAALMPGSDLRVNDVNVNLSMMNEINRIARFLLNSSQQKQFVIDLMVELANIQMGRYYVVSNNCRDFVERAIEVIEAARERCSDEDSSSSEEEFNQVIPRANNRRDLQQVRQQDKNALIAAGIAFGATVLYGAWTILGSRARGNNN